MIKSFLNVDKDVKRITKKQYNKEINDAVARIEKVIQFLIKMPLRNYLNGKTLPSKFRGTGKRLTI